MGKKVKKKPKTGQKEKRGPSVSQETVSKTPDDAVVTVVKDRGICSHIDRGIDLDKLSAKLRYSESFKCEDCRGNSVDARARKGKGKQSGGGKGARSESKAVWICLECGHFSCGGVGLPTTPQSHAIRHAKQQHHWLVVHCENHQLIWCFSCDKLLNSEKSSEDSKYKQVLSEVVKRLKKKPGEESCVKNVEDIWFGSGSNIETNATNSDCSAISVACERVGYSVRGLSNLGNTCFFNSTMQNLLSINSLRDYFFKAETESIGPLTSALRKLFIETNTGSNFKTVINPRPLFGILCTKAPQFKGSLQQDSHELLRCLLDNLSGEELSSRKKKQTESLVGPTFVDTIFGGQLSSTVTCLECGYASTNYEPFLDLSLPVPTKRPPIAKRNQPVVRSKKSKLPTKKSSRNLAKIRRDATILAPQECVSDQTIAQPVAEEFDTDIALDMGLTADDLSAIQKPKNEQAVEIEGEPLISPLDSFAWLDYLDENPVDVASETDETSAVEDAVSLVNGISVAEQENTFPHSEGKNVNSQSNEGIPPEVSVSMEIVVFDGEPARCSDSSSQVCSKDSNTAQINNSEVNSLANEVVLDDKQDSLDFVGFGDLFSEPEVPVSEASDTSKNGVVVNNSSESDPDQVDSNADAPVSVESCLALFMKPELLSKDEHAWQCEKCSKALREERRRLMRKSRNGSGDSNPGIEISTESEVNAIDIQSENGCVAGNNECEADKECESEGSEQDDEADSENLKVKRDATKSTLINKAPSILTIHLKRFIQDARGRLNKLNGHVNFGEIVDLKPYMDPRCSERERYTYRLVGVVEHQGTMRGGHYVAYVRGLKDNNGDCVWYHTSDSFIGEVSFEDVLRSEGYILFYEEI
ncbi:hypothetical protein ABFS83_07G066000 [Erythranthe nasuta]